MTTKQAHQYRRELERAASEFRKTADDIRRLVDQLPERQYKGLRAGLVNAAEGCELQAVELSKFLKLNDEARLSRLLRWSRGVAIAAVGAVSIASAQGATQALTESQLSSAHEQAELTAHCVAELQTKVANLGISPSLDDVLQDAPDDDYVERAIQNARRLEQLLYLSMELGRSAASTPELLELQLHAERHYLDSIEEYKRDLEAYEEMRDQAEAEYNAPY